MSQVIAGLIAVAAVALMYWNFVRRSNFDRDFAYNGTFRGERYECKIGGINGESTMLCFVGSDMTGVYILPHPQPERWFGRYNYAIFKKSIFIPWPEMTFTTGRVPLAGECIWLRLEPRRIYLYVPRAIGMKLLQAGGRDIPN